MSGKIKASSYILLIFISLSIIYGCSTLFPRNILTVSNLKIGTSIDSNGVLSGEATSFTLTDVVTLAVRGDYSLSGTYGIDQYSAALLSGSGSDLTASDHYTLDTGEYNSVPYFYSTITCRYPGQYTVRIYGDPDRTTVTNGTLSFTIELATTSTTAQPQP